MRLITRQPGIHASELCREADESWGTVQYHLTLLRNNNLVQSVETGRERRFFPRETDNRRARLLAILHQGRRSEIANFIHRHPGSRQVDVCRGVSVSRKTFRSSIDALVLEGLVQERKTLHDNRYFPEDSLADLLIDGHDDGANEAVVASEDLFSFSSRRF